MKKTLLTFTSLCILILAFCFSASAIKNYTFNTVDGTTISLYSESAAVTINVFGRPTCTNTERTIYNILSAGIDKKEGIKVNFIDIDKNSKETVEAFKNNNLYKSFTDNKISFSYCTDYTANTVMWDFADEADGYSSGSVTLPVVAYVDKDGNLLKTTLSLQSEEDIIHIIENKDFIDLTFNLSVKGTEKYDYAYEVLTKLNELRTSVNLPALVMDTELLEVAMQRAAECAVYYSHTRPDGKSCFTAFSKSGTLAENIAIGYKNPSDVMKGWTNSQGHYKNMTLRTVKSVGIGVFEASDGTLCWVQFFYSGDAEPYTASGDKEAVRTVAASFSKLRLSVGFKASAEHTNNPELFVKGDTAELRLINQNIGWSYSTPEVSLPEFYVKSENEDLLYIDENGVATVKGDVPFDVTLKITNKEQPECAFKITVTIGHKHNFDLISASCINNCHTDEYKCYICGEHKTEITHNFIKFVTPATEEQDGAYGTNCAGCGKVKESSPIPKIAEITVTNTDYTYNGKQKEPVFIIKDSQGKVLEENTDYTTGKTTDISSTGMECHWLRFKGNYKGYRQFTVFIRPAAPSKLKLKATATTITASWKNGSGAWETKVELLKGSKVVKTVFTYDNTVKFEKLSKNTKYTVRVTSVSAFNDVYSKKSPSAETATVSAPTLKIKAQKKKATLSWEKVKNADGYVIYMATSKNGKYKKITTVKKGSTVKYTKKKLKTGKKYYFKIKAFRTVGKKNIYSNYSSVKSVKIK